MKRKSNIPLLLFILLIACVDPYDIENSTVNEMLVVEGVLSNQFKRHQIMLSRSSGLNEQMVLPEQGATVTIADDLGQVIPLSEGNAGVYETPEFSAQSGRTYTLHIIRSNGSEYSSRAVAFTDGPDIGDVYAKYVTNPYGEGKGVQVFVDTEDPTNQAHFFRWNYVETAEVHAPFPSNWIWTGGTNLEFRYDGIDTCYRSDTLRTIMLFNTSRLSQSKVTGFRIRYIDENEHILRYKYSILVQQYCLSKEAYEYWENIRILSESQGSLSDLQPGSLEGNMLSVNKPDEKVLGYFDVGRVSEKRIFFSAIKFYNDGMKMPPQFRNYCNEVTPVVFMQSELPKLMPTFERNYNVWEVAGMSPAIVVTLMPKTCTDCRDQGPTKRPDFF